MYAVSLVQPRIARDPAKQKRRGPRSDLQIAAPGKIARSNIVSEGQIIHIFRLYFTNRANAHQSGCIRKFNICNEIDYYGFIATVRFDRI